MKGWLDIKWRRRPPHIDNSSEISLAREIPHHGFETGHAALIPLPHVLQNAEGMEGGTAML